MIRRTRTGASGFERSVSKKCKRFEWLPRSSDNAHYSSYHPDYFGGRGVARMAVQHRMGLLPERRTRGDSVDHYNSRRDGETVTFKVGAQSCLVLCEARAFLRA